MTTSLAHWTLPLFLLGCSDSPAEVTGDSLPSAVVLITVDTLRADSVSFMGNEPRTTPFLEGLAADGVVFTSAYSPSSWTVPSMASLFTGVAPSSHGVVSGRIALLSKQRERKRAIESQPVLPESFTTLAETFQRAGYRTVGIPSNIHLADYLGFGQGFDEYFGPADFGPADQVNATVAEYLRRAFGTDWKTAWKEQPTLLWIHYFDPHDPYFIREPWTSRYAPELPRNPRSFPANMVMRDMKARYTEPDEALAEKIRPLYHAEINYLDEHLRRLDDVLGISDDDVLFVLTADHGEEIVDHGKLGHGHSLYEELVHVPLLVHWPAKVQGGRRVEALVSLLDVYPTLADLKGIHVPASLQGHSLAPVLLGDGEGAAHSLHFELDRPGVKAAALRRDNWKLVHTTFPENNLELFDLAKDPGERLDLVKQEPGVVQELQALLLQRLESLAPPPEDGGQVIIEDETILEQLRAFGYAGDDSNEDD